MSSKGIYFLANNRVLDLAVAFLNSFRRFNPELSLCLIPFDYSIDQIEALQSIYQFSIYADDEVLRQCDDLSLHFHKTKTGHYRKLACWQGEFEEFIYIDVDTVVLANVNFVFRFLSEFDFVTSHSNLPEILAWVWKPSIFSTTQLSGEQIEFAANTGFICSKREALEFTDINDRLESAIDLSRHMVLSCKEQAFLNYLIVTSGRSYTSLLRLAQTKGSRRLLFEHWAGETGLEVVDGFLVEDGKRAPILLVHWAGEWEPRLADKLLRMLRKLFGFGKSQNIKRVRLFMPYKELWEYYRFLSDTEQNSISNSRKSRRDTKSMTR